MLERRLLLQCSRHEQLLADDAFDVLELAAFARDAARDLLSEVGMAVGPDAHAIHERLSERLLAAETERELVGLLGREVAELDRLGGLECRGIELALRR